MAGQKCRGVAAEFLHQELSESSISFVIVRWAAQQCPTQQEGRRIGRSKGLRIQAAASSPWNALQESMSSRLT